jgi:hypothetical protein
MFVFDSVLVTLSLEFSIRALSYCMAPQPPQDGRWATFVPVSYKNMALGDPQLEASSSRLSGKKNLVPTAWCFICFRVVCFRV